MPDMATLEALREGFWLLYPLALFAGLARCFVDKNWLIGRVVLALVLGSSIMAYVSGGEVVTPWTHMSIDVVVLAIITVPPRSYWQSIMAGLVLGQIAMHACWWLVPDMAREHWLGTLALGYLKSLVLLLWAGGPRVENLFSRIAGRCSDMVHSSRRQELA